MRRLEPRIVLDAAAAVVVDEASEKSSIDKAIDGGGDVETVETQPIETGEGGSVVLTTDNLTFTSPYGRPPENITYTITTDPEDGFIVVNGENSSSFTQEELEAGLVVYQHGGKENDSSDSFAFIVTDDVFGQGEGTLDINIFAANNQVPAIDLDTDRTGRGHISSFTEGDEPIAIVNSDGLDITDLDVGATHLQSATITLTNRLDGDLESLILDVGDTGITLSIDENADQIVLTLEGNATIEDYEAVISTLQYSNDSENINTSNRVVQVTVNDGVNQSEVSTSLITITSVNDAPTITQPAELNATEDTASPIPGVVITDVDAGDKPIKVTLTVENGVLDIPDDVPLDSVDGDGSDTLALTGTLDDINDALAGLTYTGDPNFNGTDSLQIVANDLGNTSSDETPIPLEATASIDINVAQANDAPVIAGPNALTGTEDTPLDIPGLSISDIDANEQDQPLLVTLTVPDGALALNPVDGLNVIDGDGSDGVLVIEGSPEVVNAALASLQFTPNAHFNGDTQLQIDVNDQSGVNPQSLEDSHTIAITLAPVNDAPTIEHPPSQLIGEETPTPINGVSIDDVDAEDGPVLVTLSVNNGIINLPDSPLLKDPSENGSDTIELEGTVDEINELLEALSYTGDKDFLGEDQLQITVNDQGNTGGPALETSSSMLLDVSKDVNDAPVITGPTALEGLEDTPLIIRDPNTGESLAITDVDADEQDQTLLLTLSVDHGSLSITPPAGLTLHDNNGSDGTLVFEGDQATINAALETLAYFPDDNYNGEAVISMTVNDQSTVEPVSLSDEHTVVVDVKPVDDAPEIPINQVLLIDEMGKPAPITNDSLMSTDIDTVNENLVYTITELPEHGELLFNGKPIEVGDQFTQADIESGALQYTPHNDGASEDFFYFQLTDGTTTLGDDKAIPFTIKYPSTPVPEDPDFNYQPHWLERDPSGPDPDPLQTSDFGIDSNDLDLSRPDYLASAQQGVADLAQDVANEVQDLATDPSNQGFVNLGFGFNDSGKDIVRACSEVAGLGGCNLAETELSALDTRIRYVQPELLGRYLDPGSLKVSLHGPGVEQGLVAGNLLTVAASCDHLNEPPEEFGDDFKDRWAEDCNPGRLPK